MILGIDAGNHEVKVMGPFGPMKFLSDIGEYRNRRLEQTFGEDDMVCEYMGRKFFAGSLAKYESEFTSSMMGDNKAHEDTLLRVLLALHRYSDSREYQIVVGQTISQHTKSEKGKIKEMIIGRHTVVVNGVSKTFTIKNVEVAAEGLAAYASHPMPGLVRIIDVGSGTVNFATILDGKYIDKDSFTLVFGANTTMSKDVSFMARRIAAEAIKKWERGDNVYLVGGYSEIILPYISQYFTNMKILKPKINLDGTISYIHPVFGNSVGNYELARRLYAKTK